MSDIFVIYGSCGEYSDSREWPVAYVTDEDEARAYVSLCQEQADALPSGFSEYDFPTDLEWPRPEDFDGRTDRWKAAHDEYRRRWSELQKEWLRSHGITADPHFSMSYSRTTYHYTWIPRGREVHVLLREGREARQAHQANSCPTCATPIDTFLDDEEGR